MGSDPAICKLNKNRKRHPFSAYIMKDICRKGCFFVSKFSQRLGEIKEKMKITAIIVCLIGIAVGGQMIGTYLYEKATKETDDKTEETVENRNVENGTIQVVLDSGHGGGDPGKVGINGALEKDINLKIAKKIETYLKEKKISVFMTRVDEKGLANSKIEDMKARITMINEKNPVLAVSIHQNSYEQESIQGAQVFYYAHSKEGKKAAEVMQESLLSVDSENKRQAKANDTYYMLRRTEVPVIIVECGFLSNKKEAELLNSEEYQEKMAAAICDGVERYLAQK